MTRISIVLQIKHRMVHYLVIEPTPCIATKYILPVVHHGSRISVTCSFTLFTSRYPSFLPIPWTNRLAVGSKHLNLFTREEQANAFSASYKTLDVHTTTLRNLGNFKGALLANIRKIHGIKKPRAFQLLKDGDQQVTVGMKEFMHHERFTGMTREGVFGGPPHELFIGSIPKVEDAPPFEFKAIDEITLDKIQQRYDCVHSRLEALYPDGKICCLCLAVHSCRLVHSI